MFTKISTAMVCAAAVLIGGCTSVRDTVDPVGRTLVIKEEKIAQAALDGGNYDTAIRIYKERQQAAPDDAGANMNLGNALMAAKAYDEAALYYRKAQKAVNWAPEPLVGLGRLALRWGKPGEAKQYFTQAISRSPNDYAANNGLAVTLDNLGQHSNAQSIYQSLLRRRPDDLNVRSNHALSMALGGNPQRSVKYLLGFASSPSAPRQARQNLAVAYALSGDFDKARQIMELDLPKDATNNNIHYLRSVFSGQAEINSNRVNQMFSM